MRKATKIIICTCGLIMLILSMVVHDTRKDRIIVALIVFYLL